MGTRAWIGGGANVEAGSLRILATATDTATATLLAVSVGLVAGAGGTATATIDNDVETFIGPRTGSAATVVGTTGGILNLIATSSQSASTPVSGGAGGGIDVAFVNGNATVQSTVQAFIGNGTTIAAAGNVQLRAEVVGAVASSSVNVGGGGVISVGGVGANASSKVVTKAFIGDGVTLGTVAAPVNGDVSVTAIGRGEADASGRADGGGGIRVALPQAKSFVDPDVDAHVGTAAGASRTTVVVATGSITVLAQLTKAGVVVDDRVQSVSASGDTLRFSYPGIGEGAQVQYSGPAIGGLNSGRTYTVLNAGTNLIRLGSVFDATTAIDPVRETITFSGPHGFNSGECVWYDPRAGSSAVVGAQANSATNGCNAAAPVAGAQRYFVRVIDTQTIQLTTTQAAALATSDATITATPGTPATAGDPTPLTLSSTAGLAVGTQVRYRAPVNTQATFFGSQVNVNLETRNVNGQDVTVPAAGHNDDADNVFVGATIYNALNRGDAVLFTSSGPSFGLSNDTTYYVIKNPDGHTVRFATSYCLAVGEVGDATNCDDVAVTDVDLTAAAANDGALYSFARSLGGLVDGQSYYVASISGSVITLSATPGGTGLVLDATRRPGAHRLGIVEVDLVLPTFPDGASTTQAIFANLTTDCTVPVTVPPTTAATCGRLLAPSGQPLSSVAPPAGDGISTASAAGGNGGLGNFPNIYAEVTGSPSVALTIGALQLIAGVDVLITADSAFSAGASADTAGGGVVSVQKAESHTELGDTPTSIGFAAGSNVSAGRDVIARAVTDHTITSSARAVGGGLISTNTAYTHAGMDDDVTIVVGTAGTVTAGRALRMDIATNTTASTSSETWQVGGGAFSDSDHDNGSTRGVHLGSSADPTMRSITVGARSQLTGRTVELDAAVVGINVTARADARAYCPIFCIATAFADSQVELYSRTLVQVLDDTLGTTTITGIEGVDLKARHVDTVPGSATA